MHNDITQVSDEQLVLLYRQLKSKGPIAKNNLIYQEIVRRIEVLEKKFLNHATQLELIERRKNRSLAQITRNETIHDEVSTSKAHREALLTLFRNEIRQVDQTRKNQSFIRESCSYSNNWECKSTVENGIIIEIIYSYILHKVGDHADTNTHFHAWITLDKTMRWHAKKRNEALMQFDSTKPYLIYLPQLASYETFEKASEGVSKSNPLRIFYNVLPI